MSSTPEYAPLPQNPHEEFEENEGDENPFALPSPILDERAQLSGRIRWIYFVFGSAVLLPWNVLITATPFFLSRLIGSSLRSAFSSYLSITFTVANFVFLAHATVTSKRSSPTKRAIKSTAILAFLNLLLTASTGITPQAEFFFAFVLSDAVLQACFGSYLQTATVVTASLFGPSAMQAMMAGQAFVGVMLSLVQLLSAAASIHSVVLNADYDTKSAEAKAAAIFFGLSTVFLVCTLGAQVWLARLSEYRAIVKPVDQAKDGGALLLNAEEKGRILRVAKMNIEYEVAVAYVFVVTLAVYPPITTSIMSTNPATHPLLFNALHFLLFNVGDLAGRYLCAIPKFVVWSPRKLLTLSFTRTLFIPLFLLCNLQPLSSNPVPLPAPGVPPSPGTLNLIVGTPFINSDVLFFLILIVFGLSNGYVSSMCMMAAPSERHNPHLRERSARSLRASEDVDVAATVANFCLIGGLAVGSAASFAVRAQVCQCNPFTQ